MKCNTQYDNIIGGMASLNSQVSSVSSHNQLIHFHHIHIHDYYQLVAIKLNSNPIYLRRYVAHTDERTNQKKYKSEKCTE